LEKMRFASDYIIKNYFKWALGAEKADWLSRKGKVLGGSVTG